MNFTRVVTTLAVGASVAVASAALGVDFYCWFMNTETNHTGLPLSLLRDLASGGAIAVAAWLIWTRKTRLRRTVAWVAFACCVAAALDITALEKSNVMMEYDTWTAKGMPDR